MKITSSVRAYGAGLAVAVAAAGLVMVPTTAHAGVLDTASSQAAVGFSASGGCTETGPGDATSPATPFAADGVPVTTTVTSSATVTHNVDNTDVTTMTGTVSNTVRATQLGGALRTLEVDVTTQLSLLSSKGTAQACGASVTAQGVDVGFFDLPTPKYVTAHIKSKGAVGILILQNAAGPVAGTIQQVQYFLHSNLTQRIYLPAGTWILQVQNQNILQAPTPAQTMTSPSKSTLNLDLVFDDPGVATEVAKGSGSKYLDLADGRACAAGSVAATWTAKAGKGDKRKVKKAIFRVDGVKAKVVKKPKKKQTTTLTGLDPDEMAEVSVSLKLVEKGADKLAVERTYLPCT
ncbi:hypothetical protein [Nocardioides sp.]|uniref:hypothetical protein n=1 Tax=Nocardioides sp. TaxID=35761 RepID=UPI001A303FA6|nr:hypothetical protein [Nocardioides sp.]MBJ7356832.1 hypothetical protein [Nocardioides sp.]